MCRNINYFLSFHVVHCTWCISPLFITTGKVAFLIHSLLSFFKAILDHLQNGTIFSLLSLESFVTIVPTKIHLYVSWRKLANLVVVCQQSVCNILTLRCIISAMLISLSTTYKAEFSFVSVSLSWCTSKQSRKPV